MLSVLIFAILVGTSLIVPSLLFSSSSFASYPSAKPQGPNKTCSVCPPAASGGTGPTGKSGPPGKKGVRGKSGPEGPEGREGIIGPSAIAICLPNNPVCQVGPSGATGAKGAKGDIGDRGFQGWTGEGFIGPTGQTGPKGDTGDVGGVGPNGTIGETGICGCYNISDIAFPTLSTENVQLNGTFNCEPGSMIDVACLANGTACPNFTMCNLESRNLIIRQNLTIGDFGSLVFMGDPSIYTIDSIRAYADTILLETDGMTAFKTRNNGIVSIESNNSISILSNDVNQFSANDRLTMTANGFTLNSTTGQMLVDSYGPIVIKNASLQNDNIIFQSITNGQNYLTTSGFSFDYMNYTVDNTRQSVVIYKDLILTGSLVSSTSQFLSVGPKINVGVGKIKCTKIQASAAISLETQTIRNDLTLTPSAIGNLSAGHLHLSDPDGIRIGGGNVIIDTPNTTVSSDLYVNGILHVATCIGCTSDKRLKESVQKIYNYEPILKLKPVSYQFTDEYTKTDPSIEMGTRYNGFIAQDVESYFPYAVKKRKAFKYDDFHTLDKSQLIANLVVLMQSMYKDILRLKMELK